MPHVSAFQNIFNEVSILTLVQSFAAQLRSYAKDAGTACDLPCCDALTLGVRCETCTRRICMGHAYWKLQVPRVFPHCPLCLVQANANLFSDGDDDADADDEDNGDGGRLPCGCQINEGCICYTRR